MLISWICSNCKKVNRIALDPASLTTCSGCSQPRVERYAQVRSSQRTVIDRHPLTGQINVPMRADEPMHPKQAALGYIREELPTYRDVAALESKGLVHESTSYSGPVAPTAPTGPTGLDTVKMPDLTGLDSLFKP